MYWLDGQDVPLHPARYRYEQKPFRKRCLALAIDDVRLKADDLRGSVAMNDFSRWQKAAARLVDAHLHLVTLDERFASEDGLTGHQRSWRRLHDLAASWRVEVCRSAFNAARTRYLATHAPKRTKPPPPVKTLSRPRPPTVPIVHPQPAVVQTSAAQAQIRAAVDKLRRALDNRAKMEKARLEESREQERRNSLIEEMEQESRRVQEESKAAKARFEESIARLSALIRRSTPRTASTSTTLLPQPGNASVASVPPRAAVPPVPRVLPEPPQCAPTLTAPSAPTATPLTPTATVLVPVQMTRDAAEVVATVPEKPACCPTAPRRRRRRGGRRRHARTPQGSDSDTPSSGTRGAAGVSHHGESIRATSPYSVSALPSRVRHVPPKPALSQLPPARSRPTPIKDPPNTSPQVITCPPKEFSRLQAALRTASRALSVVSNSRTYAMVAAGLVTPLRLTM